MLRSYVGRAAAVAAIFASCLGATLSREKSVQFVKPLCTQSRRL
jgi:hypothetical protein